MVEKINPNDKHLGALQTQGEVNVSELAAVLDSVNGLFCAYNTQGRIVYMNKKFKELTGYSDEILNSMDISELASNPYKKKIRKSMRSRLEKGNEENYEICISARDGRNLNVAIKASPLFKQDRIVGGIILVEDITERKQTEAELLESKRRMADTIESLPDATLVIDRDGKVLYWNRAIVEMTGFLASDMVGKGNYEYAIPFYGTRRPILIDMIVDSSVKFDKQYTYVHKEGNVLFTETKIGKLQGKEAVLWGRATPLFDTQGQVVGAIESIRDISERKNAEEQLKKSRDRLEDIFCGIVNALAVASEKRDQYTAGHQHRVAALSCAIAREMGLSPKRIQDINIAGLLHDIGKLYVPLDILSKPGPLSYIERLMVMTHAEAGYDIIKSIPFDGPIGQIILQHHERINGSGYPNGLNAKEILLESMILAVADVVESMATHRPYRPAVGMEKALEEIQINAGILYDEAVVDACVRLIKNNRFLFDEGQ
jgi:PAS domain S-box-containing protein/putative nucleotidyltransferase with HDIG domain